MKELANYILQFGNLNQQQIALITNRTTELEIKKNDYFVEAGKCSTKSFSFWRVFYVFAITTTKAKKSQSISLTKTICLQAHTKANL